MDTRYLFFRAAVEAKKPFSKARRSSRMDRFISTMSLRGGERIIDMGGTDVFWQDCPLPLDLTIVNLPGVAPPKVGKSIHKITYVEGDACELGFAADNAFEIAFSNSVIEHVGPPINQLAFAREARRVAPRYWIQTPSIWFPIEAHNHMPFWWAYPEPMQRKFIERWRKKLPLWTEMIEGTTVIRRDALMKMFPEGEMWTERFAGLAKSYVIYRNS